MAVESEGEYRLVGLALEFFLLTSALSGSTAFQSKLHKCVFHPINFKAVMKSYLYMFTLQKNIDYR